VSEASPTVLAMIHPWRRLRAFTHIELRWHDDGDMGETDHEEGWISIRRGMTQAERRCTVQHELIHVERGTTLEGVLNDREELQVRRLTARSMLPDIRVVGEALAWARDHVEAADELWVDEAVLLDRLHGLHPAERHYLTRRLAQD
jgi:hypothetical protein